MNLDGHNQLIDDLNDWDILQSLPYAQTAEQFKLIDNDWPKPEVANWTGSNLLYSNMSFVSEIISWRGYL